MLGTYSFFKAQACTCLYRIYYKVRKIKRDSAFYLDFCILEVLVIITLAALLALLVLVTIVIMVIIF